jgi:hypothetical protein
MLLAWMGYSLLFGALVCAAALAAERVSATWGRAQRFVWLGALIIGVATPPLLATRPRVLASAAPAQTGAAPLVGDSTIDIAIGGFSRTPMRESLPDRVSRLLAASDDVVIGAWAMASLLGLGLLSRAAISLRRRRAGWRPAEMDGVSVLVAPNIGPAVVGALAPRVVVPQWSLGLDASARSLMLRHEVEHIRARDPLLLFGAVATAMLAPWNAALWFIVRRLHLAVEIDCDQRVLRASAQPREYGELLLTVGARLNIPLPFATSLAERRPSLERRIRAMTRIRPRHPRIVTAACVALVAVATTAAQRSPHPRSLVTRSAPPSAIAPSPVTTTAPAVLAPVVTRGQGVTLATRQSAPAGAPAASARITSAASAIARHGPDSLTVEEIRAMIAAHHPSALAGDPDINAITLVVNARGQYVVSLAESRPFDVGGRGRRGGAGVGYGVGDGVNGGGVGGGGRGQMDVGRMSPPEDSAREAEITAAVKALRDRFADAGQDPSQVIPVQRTSQMTLRGDTIITVHEARAKLASDELLLARDSTRRVAETKAVADMVGINMPALAQLIDLRTMDAVKVDVFKPGELGTTALRVYIVRQKP